MLSLVNCAFIENSRNLINSNGTCYAAYVKELTSLNIFWGGVALAIPAGSLPSKLKAVETRLYKPNFSHQLNFFDIFFNLT